MPELPEVETTLQGIKPHIEQQIITKIVVRQPQLRWLIPADIEKILTGEKIIQLGRRGKYLLLYTSRGAIIIHLGMSGTLRILPEAILPGKHDHVDLQFNNKILRFNDPRRFGAFLWAEGDPETHPLLKNLGVEPLSEDLSGNYLWLKARGKSLCIKSFLMNHKMLVGIGNIYAAEALFAAGIYPAAPAKSLTVEKMELLVSCIREILYAAIRQGGTTLKDFLNSEGKPGYFSNALKVYGRSGLACMSCHAPLQTMRIGQRSTVYCEHCQSKP